MINEIEKIESEMFRCFINGYTLDFAIEIITYRLLGEGKHIEDILKLFEDLKAKISREDEIARHQLKYFNN
jgi:hypothetical protein